MTNGPEHHEGSGVASLASVVVITGMSGAGRSTALRALEDTGFFCVDNLPTPLCASVIASCEGSGVQRVGLGIDVRIGATLADAAESLRQLGAPGRSVRVVFLDASDEALLRRFSSTRRPHPLDAQLGTDRSSPANDVVSAITLERERLGDLRALADTVLDTTRLSVHDLRRRVVQQFGPGSGRQRMRTRLMSFGFKYGVPTDADLMFDVRFLRNPFFIDELRPLSGLDAAVRDYVLQLRPTSELVERLNGLLSFAIPCYESEGKSYLTIAIGCTGGRHRSVALAEHLAKLLREQLDLEIDVDHRDIREVERSGG